MEDKNITWQSAMGIGERLLKLKRLEENVIKVQEGNLYF